MASLPYGAAICTGEGGPKDHINIRISHSGFKGQEIGNTGNQPLFMLSLRALNKAHPWPWNPVIDLDESPQHQLRKSRGLRNYKHHLGA